jgi:hypothetical protein
MEERSLVEHAYGELDDAVFNELVVRHAVTFSAANVIDSTVGYAYFTSIQCSLRKVDNKPRKSFSRKLPSAGFFWGLIALGKIFGMASLVRIIRGKQES